jgi:hypothetical protein
MRQPHTLKGRAVVCLKAKLTCIWLDFSSVCFFIVLKISLSNSLPVVDKRVIGRKFWGDFEFLPGFGRVVISASFQGARKYMGQKQWLNKRVK